MARMRSCTTVGAPNNGVMHKSEFNSAVSGATEERSELAGAANVPEGGAG